MDTLFELNDLGLLCISGPDAKKFLQGQLTCNVEEITPSLSRLSAHCNPQGRVISLFRLFLFTDQYYLQMPRELLPIAMKALQKYAVFFKVTISDHSDDFKQIGFSGESLPNTPQTIDTQLTTEECVCIRVRGPKNCYQWIGYPEAILQRKEQLSSHAAFSPQMNHWKLLEISQGIPAIYPETSEKFLPHDIDLPKLDAVSFNKGCYTGQEIIARMHYRGKLKNHLYQARSMCDEHVTRGEDIYLENKSSGSIVDFAKIDYNNYALLIIAQDTEIGTGKLMLKKKYFIEF